MRALYTFRTMKNHHPMLMILLCSFSRITSANRWGRVKTLNSALIWSHSEFSLIPLVNHCLQIGCMAGTEYTQVNRRRVRVYCSGRPWLDPELGKTTWLNNVAPQQFEASSGPIS
ncbi:hypothetical protein B0H17DRAFT_1045585 [Mycena rosella]|uniref:Secreted protein n=1 Tax=Mycena rosella TaxID=1033263 RepID=A0AAD7GM37_MYCRO|nr:hypothetical protein B0H17DRAFT_1045585 [Mycena rosella]